VSEPYFPRDEGHRLGFSQTLLNWLASRAASTSASGGGSGGLTQADLDALETELRAYALELAEEAFAKAVAADYVPLTITEIAAALDTALLTEDGDYLLTEDGDRILLET